MPGVHSVEIGERGGGVVNVKVRVGEGSGKIELEE